MLPPPQDTSKLSSRTRKRPWTLFDMREPRPNERKKKKTHPDWGPPAGMHSARHVDRPKNPVQPVITVLFPGPNALAFYNGSSLAKPWPAALIMDHLPTCTSSFHPTVRLLMNRLAGWQRWLADKQKPHSLRPLPALPNPAILTMDPPTWITTTDVAPAVEATRGGALGRPKIPDPWPASHRIRLLSPLCT